MKVTNYYTCEAVSKVMFAFALSLIMLFSSCKDENDTGGYFALKDNPSKMEVSAQGASATYTVQSTGNWKVEPLRKEKWLKIEPMEGNGDGTFTVTVNRNIANEARAMALFFTVDGQLQNSVLRIEQEAGTGGGQSEEPYLYFDGRPESLEIPEAGVTSSHIIRSTGKWRVEIENQPEWVAINPMEGEGDTPVTLTVEGNASSSRSAKVIFFLDGEQQANVLPIYQDGAIFTENFNWLNYGNAIFPTTDGEKIISSWTAEEKERGWTSSPSADKSTPVYARPGFVKLGKTNYGADLISPKLSNVQGTRNLLVKFKAVPYLTAGGTKDNTILKVNVIGPGTVSVSEFNIDNWPNYTTDPTCTLIWQEARTERSFVITGATAETQIRFLGGDFDLRGQDPLNKNRIFLDDIVVTIKK